MYKGTEHIGVLCKDEKSILPLNYDDMIKFISDSTADERQNIVKAIENGESGIMLSDVSIIAPIPRPRHDLLCVGMNYLAHALEVSRARNKEYVAAEHPVYFSKRVHRAIDPLGVIPSHTSVTDELDYECELAIVIGKECSNVSKDDVYSHIFGYTIVNDISARNLQREYVQYTFAKGLDGFAPMGPYIVTVDEFDTPPNLDVATYVNGEKRQNSNTKDLIFDIEYLISDISRGITLYPGDVIITGTPSGVGMGFSPTRYLKKGDVVICRIEKIGELENTIG